MDAQMLAANQQMIGSIVGGGLSMIGSIATAGLTPAKGDPGFLLKK